MLKYRENSIDEIMKKSITENKNIYSEDELKQLYGLTNIKEVMVREGGFNKVISYNVVEDNKKFNLSYRKSKEPVLYRKDKYTKENLNENTRIIKEAIETKNNWLKAKKYGICPEIYYIGYVYEKIKDTYNIHLIIITKGYDYNLYDYLKKRNNLDNNTDKIITDKLVKLIEKKHDNLNLTCYDIKPENCVINKSNLDIKLIDFDSDSCFNNKEAHTPNKKLLSILLIANHFYSIKNPPHLIKHNIFMNYFTDKDIKKLKKLKKVFCDDIFYKSQINIYFDDLHSKQCNEDKEDIKNDMFDILITRFEPKLQDKSVKDRIKIWENKNKSNIYKMKGSGNFLTTVSDYFTNLTTTNKKTEKKREKRREYKKKKREREKREKEDKMYKGQSSGVFADRTGSPTHHLHDKFNVGGKRKTLKRLKTLKKSKKVKKSRKNRK
tara:strand:- start:727 stop:2037 length:1311 start_codon:yes stop_codon:yes gene_type:complete